MDHPHLRLVKEISSKTAAPEVEAAPAAPRAALASFRALVDRCGASCTDAAKLAAAGSVLGAGLPDSQQSDAYRAWLTDHASAVEIAEDVYPAVEDLRACVIAIGEGVSDGAKFAHAARCLTYEPCVQTSSNFVGIDALASPYEVLASTAKPSGLGKIALGAAIGFVVALAIL